MRMPPHVADMLVMDKFVEWFWWGVNMVGGHCGMVSQGDVEELKKYRMVLE